MVGTEAMGFFNLAVYGLRAVWYPAFTIALTAEGRGGHASPRYLRATPGLAWRSEGCNSCNRAEEPQARSNSSRHVWEREPCHLGSGAQPELHTQCNVSAPEGRSRRTSGTQHPRSGSTTQGQGTEPADQRCQRGHLGVYPQQRESSCSFLLLELRAGRQTSPGAPLRYCSIIAIMERFCNDFRIKNAEFVMIYGVLSS
jgi:hypothetical protein